MCGSELFKVCSTELLDRREQKTLRQAVSLDRQRMPTQDVRFGVRQLTEIAARALSPGINDPYTAMTCADWLADCLGELECKQNHCSCRCGPSGEPCLLERTVSFEEIAKLSFNSFRVYGAGNTIVMIHLLGVLARLGLQVREEHCRAILRQHSEAAAQVALEACKGQWDRERLEAAAMRARSVLSG